MPSLPKFRLIPFAVMAAVLSGCAATPEPPGILVEAESAYANASADPHVVRYAPTEMKRAGEALQQARQLQQERGDRDAIAHYAYLSNQRTQIARQVTESRMAQQTIANASQERNQILLEARGRESTQQATQRAEQAEARARELEQSLADLKAKRTERGVVLTIQDMLFDVGQSTLKPGAYRTVDRLSKVMKENPELTIRVEGFTDSTGSEELNLELSQNRAEAVRSALVQRGVETERIVAQGLGESQPIASNRTSAGRQQNRRVEIIVSGANEGSGGRGS